MAHKKVTPFPKNVSELPIVFLTGKEMDLLSDVSAAIDALYTLCDAVNQEIETCNIAGMLRLPTYQLFDLVAELQTRRQKAEEEGGAR